MPSDAIEALQRRAEAHHVPEHHANKPDPSEPWRFVCPDCGGQVQGKGRKYQCGACGERHAKDDLRDLKEGGPGDG